MLTVNNGPGITAPDRANIKEGIKTLRNRMSILKFREQDFATENSENTESYE
jgi:hypothetical protein